MSTPSPDAAVMSVNVPLRLLRYNAWRDSDAGRPGQLLELMNRMSGQPSPSASKNATPEPIVSGKYFFPNAPLLCLKRMPANDVTLVNVGPPDAPPTSVTAAQAATTRTVCLISFRGARGSPAARCCRRGEAGGKGR